MKEGIRILFMFILFFLIIPLFVVGCSRIVKLKETAHKNMDTDKKLPIYKLNKENWC